MNDLQRYRVSAEFFWRIVGDMILTPQEADRHIRNIARAIPPFTPIKTSNFSAVEAKHG